jgi:flagellar biogenesis protein FliO
VGEKEEGQGMRPSGWAFLFLSWGFIISLVIFCFWKIFAKKKVS